MKQKFDLKFVVTHGDKTMTVSLFLFDENITIPSLIDYGHIWLYDKRIWRREVPRSIKKLDKKIKDWKKSLLETFIKSKNINFLKNVDGLCHEEIFTIEI